MKWYEWGLKGKRLLFLETSFYHIYHSFLCSPCVCLRSANRRILGININNNDENNDDNKCKNIDGNMVYKLWLGDWKVGKWNIIKIKVLKMESEM